MKAFWKLISKILFYVISAALLVYAASRSLSFIISTLPPESQIIGYLALAATSGGAVAWLLVFLYSAEGTGQKVTAGLMVGLDLLGEFALFTFDTLYTTGKAGMTAALLPGEIRMVVLGMSGLIALNILASFAFHLVDPENARDMREAAVRDDLENKALTLIEKRGEELAGDLAPALAAQWAADFEKRFSDLRALGLGRINDQPAPTTAPAKPGLVSLPLPWVKKPNAPTLPAQPASELFEERAQGFNDGDEFQKAFSDTGVREEAQAMTPPLFQRTPSLPKPNGNGNGNGHHG